jgi:anti-anti-sigma factor
VSEYEIGIITPRGRIDAATSPQLEADLHRHMAAGQLYLIVDFSEVRYLSSSALKVLLVTLREVRRQGGDIRLVALCDRVYNIFEIAGFEKLFAIDGSVKEARTALEIGCQ